MAGRYDLQMVPDPSSPTGFSPQYVYTPATPLDRAREQIGQIGQLVGQLARRGSPIVEGIRSIPARPTLSEALAQPIYDRPSNVPEVTAGQRTAKRTLGERFEQNREDALQRGIAAALQRSVDAPGFNPATERNRREAYDLLSANDPFYAASDPRLAALATGAGQLVGAMQDPTSFISPGRTILGRAVGGAGVGGATDVIAQALDIGSGVVDQFNPLQTAGATVAPALLSLGGDALARAGRGVPEAGVPSAPEPLAPVQPRRRGPSVFDYAAYEAENPMPRPFETAPNLPPPRTYEEAVDQVQSLQAQLNEAYRDVGRSTSVQNPGVSGLRSLDRRAVLERQLAAARTELERLRPPAPERVNPPGTSEAARAYLERLGMGRVAELGSTRPAAPEPFRSTANPERADQQGFTTPAYHATRADFPTFSKGDLGFHFGTADQANARLDQTRARFGAEGENIIPVRLRMQKTLEMEDVGDWSNPTDVARVMQDTPWGQTSIERYQALEDVYDQSARAQQKYPDLNAWLQSQEARDYLTQIRGLLQADGYDSIRYRNAVESNASGAYRDSPDNPYSYIVFDQKDVRSTAEFGPAQTARPRAPEPLAPVKAEQTSPRVVQQAQRAGYAGQAPGEAVEYLAATAKGLPMDQASRLQRARDLGFNISRILYHGTKSRQPLTEFKRRGSGREGSFGVWFSDERDVANKYASADERVGEFYVRGNLLDLTDFSPEGVEQLRKAWQYLEPSYGPEFQILADYTGAESAFDAFVNRVYGGDIWKQGNTLDFQNDLLDALASDVQGVVLADSMEGIPNRSFVVFDPANIRSVHAAFDPDAADSPNLLAGIGALAAPTAGLGAAGAMAAGAMQERERRID